MNKVEFDICAMIPKGKELEVEMRIKKEMEKIFNQKISDLDPCMDKDYGEELFYGFSGHVELSDYPSGDDLDYLFKKMKIIPEYRYHSWSRGLPKD